MQSVTIPSMVLRVGALLNLILGIGFWTNHFDSLVGVHMLIGIVEVHMLIGILVVLAVWWLGVLALRVNFGLAVAAFVVGALLWFVGVTQTSLLPNSAHWVIQVTHLVLALAAVGVGEAIGGRVKRQPRIAA